MAILSVYSRPSSMTPPSKRRSVGVRYKRSPELSTQSGEDIIIYKLVTSHYSIRLHLKQVFQSVYRRELETALSQKPWKQEIAKIPDWPRRKAVAEFWSCIGHECLGTHLCCVEIRPAPYCLLCSLHEPTDRNHLGQYTALSNRIECERYWEARTKMMENWLCSFSITIFVTAAYCWDFCIDWIFFSFFLSLLCFSSFNAVCMA